MDRVSRIYKLHNILVNFRQPVSMRRLQEELGESQSSVKRCIDKMRTHLGAPIEYDRRRNGYFYDTQNGCAFELPGLWFNSAELYALLIAQQLLAEVQPGLFDGMIAPLRERIDKILVSGNLSTAAITQSISILRIGGRNVSNQHFQRIAATLLERKQLTIRYQKRSGEQIEISDRVVSPQRLVHYRDNWYLDAWCHKQHGLRTFALDSILEARSEKAKTKKIRQATLNAHYASGYGIFAGKAKGVAVLAFSPKQARWVANETWHPQQQGKFLADGCYELRLPYSHTPELVMDILKYGAEVEVVSPQLLRQEVAEKLREAAARYK